MSDQRVNDERDVAFGQIFEIIGSMTDLSPENAQKVFHVMSLISPHLIEDEDQPS